MNINIGQKIKVIIPKYGINHYATIVNNKHPMQSWKCYKGKKYCCYGFDYILSTNVKGNLTFIEKEIFDNKIIQKDITVIF